MACTYTTQIPLVKVARRLPNTFFLFLSLKHTFIFLAFFCYEHSTFVCRWNFLQSGETIRKLECSDILPRASVQDLGVVLMGAGYEVITQYFFLFLIELFK